MSNAGDNYGDAGPGVVIPLADNETCEDCGETFEDCRCDDEEICDDCGEDVVDCMCGT